LAAYWICAAFTLVSALVSLGYSIAAVRAAERDAGPHARYAFVRSFGLVVVAVGSLLGEHHYWLVAAATAMIVVQAGDAVVGVRTRDRLKVVGPAVLRRSTSSS
jgi:hypothetical protein